MVAAKDVSMEPTIKSLNDDLVGWSNKKVVFCRFCWTFNVKRVNCREKRLRSLRKDTSRMSRGSKKWTWKSEYEVGRLLVTAGTEIISAGTKFVEMTENGRRC